MSFYGQRVPPCSNVRRQGCPGEFMHAIMHQMWCAAIEGDCVRSERRCVTPRVVTARVTLRVCVSRRSRPGTVHVRLVLNL